MVRITEYPASQSAATSYGCNTSRMSGEYAHSFMRIQIAMLTFENSPKKAANLTLNSAALALARELGMNVSQTVDAFLQAEVRRLYREKWRAENQAAIAAYNERGKRDGVFGDGVRSF